MSIAENLCRLQEEIPGEVKVVAVSKTMPVSAIFEAYHAGQRAFGENRAQELAEKQKLLPRDIEWHMIGHLQTNKVKLIVPFIHMIHSVDSLKLLAVINDEAGRINRQIDCLFQMRIAMEETKFGMTEEDLERLLMSSEYQSFRFIRITGLMGMATFTTNLEHVKLEFLRLASYYTACKSRWFQEDPAFREISMGMSGDYKVALEAGSTMVRIGSLIFGDRIYNQ
jgi:pyridoxal phosphate enzyme (YggS family)